MNALVAVLLAGIGFRLLPEAPTEAVLLVALAVILALGELLSARRGRVRP